MNGDLAIAVDMCPVCKSTPITTPGLRFKINSKCYHRICEGCVDRKFLGGKSNCPISGCKHQLWKRDWKVQTFEDLEIEREVDLRRRVMRALDREEDEFESKRDWDNFLELREEMIMNLVLNTDAATTRRKLEEYEIANGLKARVLPDGSKPPPKPKSKNDGAADPSGLIKGLKKIIVPIPRSPYDPFMGMSKSRGYYDLRDDYETRYDKMKSDGQFDPAGYNFQQYMDESLLRAYAGLCVFVGDDSPTPHESAQTSHKAGIQAMKAADDVF